MIMRNKMLAVDFDATIAYYDTFRGKGVFGEPITGAKEALQKLKDQGWIIIINTTRSETYLVKEYLQKHNIVYDYVNFNPENHHRDLSPTKVIADVYLDDRAITFDGDWNKAFKKIINFEPWYKKIDFPWVL